MRVVYGVLLFLFFLLHVTLYLIFHVSPQGNRKAVNPYTWLVCAKIVKRSRGEREPTQGSMFSAGHEPTQDSAFGEGFESTQSSALGVGHEPTQDSAFGEGREYTRTDSWDRRGGSA